MKKKPLISIIMGSKSDWPTMEHAALILKEFKIPHEIKVIFSQSTERTYFQIRLKKEALRLSLLVLEALHTCLV